MGSIDLGDDGTGRRRRASVTGKTKTAVRDKLRTMQHQLEA